MVTSMPFDRSRQKIIRDRMKKQESDAGNKDSLRNAKLTVKGTTQTEPIYKFDLFDISFNKVNGRIKAEVFEKEAELGRDLNVADRGDQEILKELLLSIRKEENERIKEDLRKNTQIYPGIITCDGIVINGNRRKALLQELYEEKGDDKFKYLDVHVLPSDITKAELWLIEAGIQLSTTQQLDYSPINHLLKLREGIKSGLNTNEMANRIYGVSVEQIEKDLKRLKLIDEYLDDFLLKTNKYYLVKGLNEHFIDLIIILDQVLKPKGNIKRDWAPDENDINELKIIGFCYIRMKMPHLRIRDLRNIFWIKNSWEEAKRALLIDSQLSEDELLRFGLSPISEEAIDEDDFTEIEEDTEEDESIISSVEEKDQREEAIWRELHTKDLKAIFEDAKEQEKITKDTKKPIILANRALKILEAMPTAKNELSAEIDSVLQKIIHKVNKLRKIIGKNK